MGQKKKKAGCGTGSGVRSSICDICVDLNDEKDKLEDEAAAEFTKNKTAFGIGKTRPRTNNE
jgi:hypothetical protein